MTCVIIIGVLGSVMIVNALFMETQDSANIQSFALREFMIGVLVLLVSLLTIAFIMGRDYDYTFHEGLHKKQAIESEVTE